MGFSSEKNKALDRKLPIGQRVKHLCGCIEHVLYSYEAVEWHEIKNYYQNKQWIFPVNDPSKINLIVNELEEKRNRTIELRQQFWDYRRQRKKDGYNKPGKIDWEFYNKINNQIVILWKKFRTNT